MNMQSVVFVGLGNPGPQYEKTRHNLGFLVLNELAQRLGWNLKEDRRFNARVAKGVIEDKSLHLILPLTYMNLSGEAIGRYLDYYKIPAQAIIVVTDDVALPLGHLRLRNVGGAGGHNGLKSIQDRLGTSHYKRLRMGIGHPGERVLANYVLESFNQEEQQKLPTLIDSGVEVLQRLLKESFSQVMTSVNAVSKQDAEQSESEHLDLTKPPMMGRGE